MFWNKYFEQILVVGTWESSTQETKSKWCRQSEENKQKTPVFWTRSGAIRKEKGVGVGKEKGDRARKGWRLHVHWGVSLSISPDLQWSLLCSCGELAEILGPLLDFWMSQNFWFTFSEFSERCGWGTQLLNYNGYCYSRLLSNKMPNFM